MLLKPNTGGGVTDHGALTGLADDDHTQYALLAGRTGVSAFTSKLEVTLTTEQLRIGYDASNYYSTTVGATGGVTFNAVGSGAGFTFSDDVTIGSGGQIFIDNGAAANPAIAATSDPDTGICMLFGNFSIVHTAETVIQGQFRNAALPFGWTVATGYNAVLGGTTTQRPGAGTNSLIVANGTAPSSLAANTSGLYAADVSASSELFAINEAGEVTQLTGNVSATYQLSWGGNMSTAGYFLNANSDAALTERSAINAYTSFRALEAGTITAFSWSTASGDATTVFKIHINSVVQATITCSAADGLATGLSVSVAADDDIAIEFDAGTAPGVCVVSAKLEVS